ncbi:MAG: hypothetical protein J4O09_12240, partial [Chloroflexi bacterium]|nr:hypothetical protein [Chloroflexota bacterium]
SASDAPTRLLPVPMKPTRIMFLGKAKVLPFPDGFGALIRTPILTFPIEGKGTYPLALERGELEWG